MRALLMAILFATTATADPIVIRAARVIDGRGHVYDNAGVVVDASKIVRIETDAAKLKNAAIDLGNRTLMPGGVDTHVHLAWHFDKNGRSNDGYEDSAETPQELAYFAMENAYRTLMGGVTTVQSLGAPVDKPLREAIARGTLPGPRVLTAIDPIFSAKMTPDDMRTHVAKLAAEGADVVKVFASESIRNGGGPTMSQEQMNAICDEARKHHLRVVVHAHGPESVRRAVLAGATSIEHGVLIGQPELGFMAEHGTYFDPNIDLIFRNYFENKSHYIGIGSYTEEGFEQMKLAVPKALEVFKKAIATPNLRVIFGTDAVAGAHGRNFQELEYRVATGGQNAMDAITSATSLSAESLGLGDRVGSIAPGYDADLIAVDGNPLQDIGALSRVSFVMKGGTVFKR